MSEPAMSPESELSAARRPIRIIIADDHPVVRIGVRNMLSAHKDFEVVGEAENGPEAVTRTEEHQPDVLLLDVQMPNAAGFDVVREVASRAPGIHIVLLTGSIPMDKLAEAFQAGARGIVLKSALTEQIATAMLAVMDGFYWAEGRCIDTLAEVLAELRAHHKPETTERYNLTRRELEVVGLIVKGYSNRDIAKEFNLSEETVKRHLSNTFEKLGISTRLELAIMAIEKKLVPPTAEAP